MPVRYQVETFTLCDGWVNCWTTYEDSAAKECLFDSKAEAEHALREHVADLMYGFQAGELDSPPSADELRVSAVYVPQQLELSEL